MHALEKMVRGILWLCFAANVGVLYFYMCVAVDQCDWLHEMDDQAKVILLDYLEE